MRVNALSGLKTLFGFGPKIARSVAAAPDGLLLHEDLIVSLFPPHLGMRQYWQDFDSLGGRGQAHIGSGGSSSCATQEAPAFGMRRISCAAAWRLCTTTW